MSTMEKMMYDEKGREICKPIEREKRLSLVFRGFTDKERQQILKSFNQIGIKTGEAFFHGQDKTYEHDLRL